MLIAVVGLLLLLPLLLLLDPLLTLGGAVGWLPSVSVSRASLLRPKLGIT